ncbi:M28 family metallopeptidase [Nocardioides aquiterrae]|uniref:Peptidase M28 domain-containing protein n=1 Tax=Nocardioides aquiterrae TaxID=203799 RepID=A0ABP4F9Z1_9ACTN
MRGVLTVSLATVLAMGTACTDEPAGRSGPPPPVQTTRPAPTSAAPTLTLREFDADRAMATVRVLAGRLGPRLATAPAYAAAADLLAPRLVRAGYEVRTQRFPVPAGDSWGVPVDAGTSFNVVAEPPGFDAGAPHVVVGAHLDTVAVAPGAEDNASGVAVVLELARVLAGEPPVVLVLFGGEEPRGPGDLHHFGSKRYVEDAGDVVAMVALDRVGVGDRVPLGSITGGPTDVRDELAGVARRLDIPTTVGTNDASDHESFADAGLPAARVGSTPYAAYHSAADVPSVVDRDQLARVGRLLTAWLRGR